MNRNRMRVGGNIVAYVAVAWTRADLAYVAVIVWSLMGIAVRQAAVRPIVLASWAGSAAVVALLIIAAARRGWVAA